MQVSVSTPKSGQRHESTKSHRNLRQRKIWKVDNNIERLSRYVGGRLQGIATHVQLTEDSSELKCMNRRKTRQTPTL
jgi:hypothetical protein